MKIRFRLFLYFCVILSLCLQGVYPDHVEIDRFEGDLLRDLRLVNQLNREIYDRLPIIYNHNLQAGYINMPSARMDREGMVVVGYSYVPPYKNYNLRMQLFDRLEITGNYRIFRGVEDKILSIHGFGDFSDKGAGARFCLLFPEETEFLLPGIAIGVDDPIGTKGFFSKYIVFTQVSPKYDVEISLGFGDKRIKGLFGGISWLPWRKNLASPLHTLSFVAEYDGIDYKDPNKEKHPRGRSQRSPINLGVKYRLFNYWDFSISSVRGEKIAAALSVLYDFGNTKGLLPKIEDPLPYTDPANTREIGLKRSRDLIAEELIEAFDTQGFQLLELAQDQNTLYARVENLRYLEEPEMRLRLHHILAHLIPHNIETVEITIQSMGFSSHRYCFSKELLERYRDQTIGEYEMVALSPAKEIVDSSYPEGSTIYHTYQDLFSWVVKPRTRVFFGSAKGKVKSNLGLALIFTGSLWDQLNYSFSLGYPIYFDTDDLSDRDMLNPSQLINVRSDSANYIKEQYLTIDDFYLQKNWNLGKGYYARIAGGYFEEMYGGGALELLYAPIDSPWAVGIEYAKIRKRKIRGLGFEDKIRRLDGTLTFFERFRGEQYFLDLYYHWEGASIETKVSIGKFLARDHGVRCEVSKTFKSGFEIYCWYSRTSTRDVVNREKYNDKGIGFSMPLDFFFMHRLRDSWGYGISAWLRDTSARSDTGNSLYELIRSERKEMSY